MERFTAINEQQYRAGGGRLNKITSAANQYVKEVRELNRKAKARREAGLFVAEGQRLCAEIPEREIVRLFVEDGYQGRMPEGLAAGDMRVYQVPSELMRQMSDTMHGQGILAVVRERRYERLEGDFFMLLETIQDPGNLGTIFRTAEAAGVDGIVMNRECVDVYSPKVVRSTMGSLFRMPFRVVPDLKEEVRALRTQGFTVYAAHLRGIHNHFECDFKGKTAFLIGNEGNGLSEELAKEATEYLRIPMQGHIESLNAAVAATVLMYETARQRYRT